MADGSYEVKLVKSSRFVVKVAGVDAAVKEFRNLPKAYRASLRTAMRAAVRVLRKGVLSRMPPKRTGRLARSIRASVRMRRGDVIGRVTVGGQRAHYASALESGAGAYGPLGRAYEIAPVRAKALRILGVAHPVRRVTVQGIRPRRFVERTAREDMARAIAAFDATLHAEIIKTAAKR